MCLKTNYDFYEFNQMKWMYTCGDTEPLVLSKAQIYMRQTRGPLEYIWYVRKNGSKYFLNHFRFPLHALSAENNKPVIKLDPSTDFSYIEVTFGGISCFKIKTGPYFLSVDPASMTPVYVSENQEETAYHYWYFVETGLGSGDNVKFYRRPNALPFPKPGDADAMGGWDGQLKIAAGPEPKYYVARISTSTFRLVVSGSSQDSENTKGYRIGGVTNLPESGYIQHTSNDRSKIICNAFWMQTDSNSNVRWVRTTDLGRGNTVHQQGSGSSSALDLIGNTLDMVIYTGWGKYFIPTVSDPDDNSALYFMTTDFSGSPVEAQWMRSSTLRDKMWEDGDNINFPPRQDKVLWLELI